MEKATFGAGCFWGTEYKFSQTEGVTFTKVGYEGGRLPAPYYIDVCAGKTGHAEVVELEFDPTVISYQSLLDIFWEMHDPTSLNRQGPDTGTQYRSVIFYHNDAQKEAAKSSKEALNCSGRYALPIVTQIREASYFYVAEEFHQKYLEKRGTTGCSI